MDDGLSRAVRTIFKRLYDAGLIYQAERLVNWSPVLETAISDLEVKYEDVEGELVSFRYGSHGRRRSRTSWWPPPASRRCSATPRSPCTPTTSGTGTWSARRCRIRSSTAQHHHRRRRARRPRIRHGRSQGHARARPQRLRDRAAAQPADAVDHGHQGPHRRHRNAVRRHGPLRGAGRGARGAGRARAASSRRSGRTCTASGTPSAAASPSSRGCRCSGGSRSSRWPRPPVTRSATATP